MMKNQSIKQVSCFISETLAVVLFFFLSSIVTAQAVIWNENVTEADVLAMARPLTSVVEIRSTYGTGSGVLITDKHVLTARHVLENQSLAQAGYDPITDILDVTMEDAPGNKTPVRAKNVYIHPSGADIAIIELEDNVSRLLSERDGTPSIIPSPLYRGDPQGLCGEVLHGAGYGGHGMATDAVLQRSNGNRYYYETSFNFVLETVCFPFSEDDPSAVSLSIDVLKERIELGELLLYLMTDPQYTEQEKEDIRIELIHKKAQLKALSELDFEVRINKRMSAETAFTGTICPGDSGSPLFNKQGHVVAVITESVESSDSFSRIRASGAGELVYPFLDWIDDVTEGRVDRYPVDAIHAIDVWLLVLDSILIYMGM